MEIEWSIGRGDGDRVTLQRVFRISIRHYEPGRVMHRDSCLCCADLIMIIINDYIWAALNLRAWG